MWGCTGCHDEKELGKNSAEPYWIEVWRLFVCMINVIGVFSTHLFCAKHILKEKIVFDWIWKLLRIEENYWFQVISFLRNQFNFLLFFISFFSHASCFISMRESCPEEFISRLLQDPGCKLLATAAAAAAITAIASHVAVVKDFYTALNK